MSQDQITEDMLTSDPVEEQEQTKEATESEALTEDTPQQNKTAKRFEKLLQQRNQALKEAEEVKAELEEYKTQSKTPVVEESQNSEVDLSQAIRSGIEGYFQERDRKEGLERQERQQREKLFNEYPEAKELESDIVEMAKAHPTVPYEGILRMVKPDLFVGGKRPADPSGSTISKAISGEKDMSNMSADEILAWGDKMAGK